MEQYKQRLETIAGEEGLSFDEQFDRVYKALCDEIDRLQWSCEHPLSDEELLALIGAENWDASSLIVAQDEFIENIRAMELMLPPDGWSNENLSEHIDSVLLVRNRQADTGMSSMGTTSFPMSGSSTNTPGGALATSTVPIDEGMMVDGPDPITEHLISMLPFNERSSLSDLDMNSFQPSMALVDRGDVVKGEENCLGSTEPGLRW